MNAERPVRAPTDPVLTRRLVLTPVGPDDADELTLLYDDPVVAYWTGPWTRASRAVMQRLGMRPAGIIRRPGLVDGRTGVQPDAPFALYRV